MEKRFFEAVATLIGTTVGAGVLGIPYVAAQAGIAIGLAHIVIIGVAVIALNLLLAEIVLKTRGNHQLTGYAEKYLGREGKRAMTLAMIVGIYGALLAYIIGTGTAINALIPELPPLAGSLVFFALASGIVYFGLSAVEKSELLLAFLTISTITVIIAAAALSGKFSAANLTSQSLTNAFLPYGVVLFAFLGSVAVPEMKEELGPKAKSLLRKAIVIGGIIPIAIYSLFAISVVGISGQATSHIATVNLGRELGQTMLLFANLFAVLAMSTSFIALGLALKEMYTYDYKVNRKVAWLLTCAVPLLAFLLGLKSFIAVLGTVGALAGGLEGMLLLHIHKKAQQIRAPRIKILGGLLFLLFLLGIIYTITIAATS
ncbi:hypothetical protein HYU18_05150 [Candidatus Woesearchaeota archaeon]|nr:hypothetical protein [Candidatus Woesearchaeota archaeon]